MVEDKNNEENVILEEELDIPSEDNEPESLEGSPEDLTEDDVKEESLNEEEKEGDFVISIGDEKIEPEENKAPDWVRDLRKANREKDRRIRELESQLSKPVQKTVLGEKPTLESLDYDAEKYEQELEKWYVKKSSFDAEDAKAKQEEERRTKEWQDKLNSYAKAKSSLKIRDFDEAEATAQELFNVTQQGIIIQGADNPAAIVYVLGKNQKKAAELSKITDPVKFAIEIGKLEKDIKMTRKTTQIPAPEKTIQGTKPLSTNATLDRLLSDAEKTGDYTKVRQYKEKLNQSKK
jgi:hypothetical protein